MGREYFPNTYSDKQRKSHKCWNLYNPHLSIYAASFNFLTLQQHFWSIIWISSQTCNMVSSLTRYGLYFFHFLFDYWFLMRGLMQIRTSGSGQEVSLLSWLCWVYLGSSYSDNFLVYNDLTITNSFMHLHTITR